ncbi:hypothetical protein L7F22_059460 [Adiantum nelumboides]|nr:hypothetical protein [Adiantum nelumboides]
MTMSEMSMGDSLERRLTLTGQPLVGNDFVRDEHGRQLREKTHIDWARWVAGPFVVWVESSYVDTNIMAMNLGIGRGIAARMVEFDAAIPDDWQQVLTGHLDTPLHVGWISREAMQSGPGVSCRGGYALETMDLGGLSIVADSLGFKGVVLAFTAEIGPEIKMKIRTGIIRAWVKKKKLKVKQELCLSEWRELIAETARRGGEGDVEYQWNSSSMLRKQAHEAIPKKSKPFCRPDALSAEHRLRISAAIKAKWSNPDYRISVETGIRNSVSKRVAVSRQARPCHTSSRPLHKSTLRKSQVHEDLVNGACGNNTAQKSALKSRAPRKASLSAKNIKTPTIVRQVMDNVESAMRADSMEVDSRMSNADMPSYKDPEAEKNLEKLKSMRARRMHLEVQKQKEITERTRALIAQAQEAAKALEAAAVKDKTALASLLETRKLLAEAVYSLESLNKKSSSIVKEDDSALCAHVMSLANAVSSPIANVNNHPENQSSNVENTKLRT